MSTSLQWTTHYIIIELLGSPETHFVETTGIQASQLVGGGLILCYGYYVFITGYHNEHWNTKLCDPKTFDTVGIQRTICPIFRDRGHILS